MSNNSGKCQVMLLNVKIGFTTISKHCIKCQNMPEYAKGIKSLSK